MFYFIWCLIHIWFPLNVILWDFLTHVCTYTFTQVLTVSKLKYIQINIYTVHCKKKNLLKKITFLYSSFSAILYLVLSPVQTKDDNYKYNYISVHTSGRYRLFILSARSSAALNSQAHDSRIDSDRASMFLSFISWKKIMLKVIPALSL